MTSLRLYTKGARVWVKDPSRVWITATVTKDFDGKSLTYETEDLETNEIKIAKDLDLPHLRNPDILIGVNDLTHLSYLHEPAVLHNLAVRFIQNQSIYTYCGIVLVAINPYEGLPLYGNDTISMYRGKNMGDLDPHIYAVAEEAFAKMERDNRDQSIIVSGESGAGKTVSAKYAMRYFATVGGTSQTETQIERRVLASSPIVEAIGNAKTTRNDNSSRFGKYIEIDFNTSFQIIGANMRTYLLEKSRVVFQASDERNYHIFYQMCAARDLPELADLKLQEPLEFIYLSQGENPIIDGVDDRSEFVSTKDAFRLLGFSEKEQTNIFRILAGILQLGNIVIDPGSGRADSDSSTIPHEDVSLKNLASLFQIKEEQMRKWLCNRRIVTVRESYDTPMSAKAASFARDALAKCIYACLFDWIVVQINKALRTSGKVHKFIGVLDIYGFETFEINSFEQFCINYANEKLQQQFNQHVFKLEQEEYLREGIEWKMIDFYDNQPCIDLIESKLGVLDLLDEECRMPKGSDKSWVDKLYDKCKKWEHFSKPRLSQTAFVVRHFADNVEYESHGFLDKNRDTVMEEQIQILKASDNDLLSGLFMEGALDSGSAPGKAGSKSTPQGKKPPSGQGGGKQNKKSVGSQFRDSLNLLVQALNCTTPHYVRCIKPNDSKVAFEFDPKRAVQQLRACGVLETVRISAAGYPSRWTYYDFYIRYRVLCHSKDVARNDFRTTCTNIIAKLIKDEDKYQFGKTKLFFRAGQVAYLEKLRSERLRDCGVMIQKNVKGWLYRKRYQQIIRSTLVIQKWVRGFMCRRHVRHLRRTKAAITLQTNIRGWVKRTQYSRNKSRTILLQARVRGYLARARHRELLRNSKAVIIQAHVRGWVQRRKYLRSLRHIVLVQSKVRQFLARRSFKKLKIEAKSIEHQKKLNKGLENKIISLQQRLTESERSLNELKKVREEHKNMIHQMDELKASEVKSRGALSRVEVLERELLELKSVLEQERSEKVDLVTERERESVAFNSLEHQLRLEITNLTNELSTTKEEASAKSQVNSEELLQRLEEEKANIHTEYEQERIAYQKLLKAYNRLEVQYENLQDELRQVRGEELMSNASLGASMLSVDFHDEESAYGSNSGRSSVRSEKARTDLEPGEYDVGLTIKMQQKLKESQQAKEKLEKKVEELESSLVKHKTQQSNVADTLKLQEYEIENGKLKDDLKKLRDSIADGYGKDSQIKEFMNQYEHMQDELERRQEECVQLRTVLANMDGQSVSFMSRVGELPDSDEIFAAYETQKNVIGQLKEEINEEKVIRKEMEFDLRREIEELARTCSEQQQLIHHAINKSPANNTEACLQHEIQRLTGENFDLREKIENLNENTKRLKRLLKTYMKKLTDVGASVPEIEQEITIPDQPESMMPMIRKKESDFMGMFEYRRDQEQQILRSLVYDLKPKMAVQMLPGLPAYILFKMIRYTDHINNDDAVRSLIQGAITMVKKVVKKKGMNDIEIKTLWLSNMLRILHNMKQYSGEKQFQAECTLKQIDQSLRHFDLSEYRRILSDVAIWIYQGMTKLMEEEIQPILVPAILEHEGIGGIAGNEKPRPPPRHQSSNDESMSPSAHVDPHEALDAMMKLLARFHTTLTKHGLDPEIISLIFKQIFYFICAGALNNLLLRKDMCHWSRGMQIRYNIAQLEQWARDKKIQDDRSQVIDSFQPIIQAAQLLQARKSDDDVQTICDMCDRLKVSQIIKILNLYTPGDEYEERVTPTFVRKIQAKLSERAIAENQAQATLLMDTKFSFAVTFPFNPSTIQLEELEIPEFYNNLHLLLKKI